MKAIQLVAEGIVGVSVELSVPEMIAVSNIKSILDKVLSDNLVKQELSSNEVSVKVGRDKYRSSFVYLRNEQVEMIVRFMSKFTQDIPSIDEAIISVFGEEVQQENKL